MNISQNNLAKRQAVVKALDNVQQQIGTLHNQINALSDLEAQAVQSGSTSTSHQSHKDAMIASSDALINQAQLLHNHLRNLP